MAAPAMAQVLALDAALKALYMSAISEFFDTVEEGVSKQEIADIATQIAGKYRMLGSELGALWYDVCSEIAGLDVDPAELEDIDIADIAEMVKEAKTDKELESIFKRNVYEGMRKTGHKNLERDWKRGLSYGRWARVPTGDSTCAWCIMLASNGAYYVSKSSALEEGHPNCDCIAVYHARADMIDGYEKFGEYKQMYYAADQARRKGDYPPEIAERIERAKEQHEEGMREGRYKREWDDTNATMIIMRDMYGLD